jgi:hypothetical protein
LLFNAAVADWILEKMAFFDSGFFMMVGVGLTAEAQRNTEVTE